MVSCKTGLEIEILVGKVVYAFQQSDGIVIEKLGILCNGFRYAALDVNSAFVLIAAA